jgi:hypothetical protein
MEDGVGLPGDLVGERFDTGVEKVEPAIGAVEPSKDLALELLEDSEGEGLIRHGEIYSFR